MKAVNEARGTAVAGNVVVARSLWERMVGLMGKPDMLPGEGLLLAPCIGVHTAFVRFPLDLLFLDRGNRVIASIAGITPFRVSPLHFRASAVLELPAGSIAGSATEIGDVITFE